MDRIIVFLAGLFFTIPSMAQIPCPGGLITNCASPHYYNATIGGTLTLAHNPNTLNVLDYGATGNFNKGYAMTELSAAALLDLDWHSLSASAPLQDANQFETAALNKEKISLPEVPSRYRSSYFLHIWANGYAAGYYAYPWTQMLADDAFDWFQNHGGLTRDNGDRFRAMILSQGNSKELAGLYQDWRGSAPRIEPMLENRGLKE